MLPTKFQVGGPQQKKRKIDFKDSGHGGHLGFPIGRISSVNAVRRP